MSVQPDSESQSLSERDIFAEDYYDEPPDIVPVDWKDDPELYAEFGDLPFAHEVYKYLCFHFVRNCHFNDNYFQMSNDYLTDRREYIESYFNDPICYVNLMEIINSLQFVRY